MGGILVILLVSGGELEAMRVANPVVQTPAEKNEEPPRQLGSSEQMAEPSRPNLPESFPPAPPVQTLQPILPRFGGELNERLAEPLGEQGTSRFLGYLLLFFFLVGLIFRLVIRARFRPASQRPRRDPEAQPSNELPISPNISPPEGFLADLKRREEMAEDGIEIIVPAKITPPDFDPEKIGRAEEE